MIRPGKRDVAAGSLLVLLVLLAFSPWWAGGRLLAPLDVLNELYSPWNAGDVRPDVHNHFTSDAVSQYLVYHKIAEQSFAQDGKIGWSALTGGGRPEYANTMALYDDWTMQLHRFLDFWSAWHIGLIGQFIIAALGMLVFLRAQQLSSAPALLGAIAYAANSQYIAWIYHRWQLGAFAWVPWLAWAIYEYHKGRRFAWPLVPLFMALSFLGGNLQTNAFTFLFVIAIWLGTAQPRKHEHFAAWIAIGLGAAAFALLPNTLALLEASGVGRERMQLGYSGGILQPLTSALFIPLQAVPTLLGSPHSLDLTKVLHLDLTDIAYFGFIPFILAIRAAFMREAPPAARWLMALGLLLPLTPVVGLLYHRVQLLFVFGGVWAFAWYWQHAAHDRSDPVLRKVFYICAGAAGIWLIASIATLIFESQITGRLQAQIAQRIAQGRAGMAGNVYHDWMLERAPALVKELRLWHPAQLLMLVAAGAGFFALRERARGRWRLASAVLMTALIVELGLFAARWVTFADPVANPAYENTTDIRAVQQRVGPGRVFVHDRTRLFFPPNTLAMYGIATIEQYETVGIKGMWQQQRYATDARSLAQVGVTHALTKPGDRMPEGWTREYYGTSLLLWRNRFVVPYYQGNGPDRVRVTTSTNNQRMLYVPAGTSEIRVSENWSPGWRFRVNEEPWQPVRRAVDASMLLSLPSAAVSSGVEMSYRPNRRVWGWRISMLAILIIGIGLLRARGNHTLTSSHAHTYEEPS